MKKVFKTIRDSNWFMGGLFGLFLGLGISGISALTNLPTKVNSGDVLSSANWNTMVDSLTELEGLVAAAGGGGSTPEMYYTPSGNYNWKSAMTYCGNLDTQGYSDWHLPTIDELTAVWFSGSVTDMGGSGSLPSNNYLWTSSINPDRGATNYYYIILHEYGHWGGQNYSTLYNIACVR